MRNIMQAKYGGRNRSLFFTTKCRVISLFVACIYTAITTYAIHVILLRDRGPQIRKRVLTTAASKKPFDVVHASAMPKSIDVEIWGKAAIGLYLWEHILEGPLEERLGGVWSFGEKQIGNLKVKFRTGPGVVPEKAPRETRNLVLVINGREPKKVQFAKAWLDSLETLPNLLNVAVVLLGNERCENEWLFQYMENRGGLVKVAFLVYDIPYTDSKAFYQWPLGVATYRSFPNVPFLSVDVAKRRKYRCNFLGTIYPNSSRIILKSVLDKYKLHDMCFVKTRSNWLPEESPESANDFRYALENSDLTLSPVGVNTECYRIYEACSYGSVPVIEDVVTPGRCRRAGEGSPLHLLKTYQAPFIYVKDWKELPRIIEKEMQLTHLEIVERRRKILTWYRHFKEAIRDKLIDVLQNTFSG